MADLRVSSLITGISSWSHDVGNKVNTKVGEFDNLNWAQMRIDETEDGDMRNDRDRTLYLCFSPDTPGPGIVYITLLLLKRPKIALSCWTAARESLRVSFSNIKTSRSFFQPRKTRGLYIMLPLFVSCLTLQSK